MSFTNSEGQEGGEQQSIENDLRCPHRVDLFVASLMKNAEVKLVTRL
jgi:hypothetical protein